jgi:hypothetical protein
VCDTITSHFLFFYDYQIGRAPIRDLEKKYTEYLSSTVCTVSVSVLVSVLVLVLVWYWYWKGVCMSTWDVTFVINGKMEDFEVDAGTENGALKLATEEASTKYPKAHLELMGVLCTEY